ncbi:MAG: hypothetical protein ACTSQ8_26340 [Candidatus Helarchaeota archaeon]
MKSAKEMTDDVIDFALEGMYSEIEEWEEETGHEYQIEEWEEETGHEYQINLSPKPELYDKLNQYFNEMYVEIMIDVLKNFYNQPKLEASRR